MRAGEISYIVVDGHVAVSLVPCTECLMCCLWLQGAVVGITDFVLGRQRSFQADTSSDCVLLEISRAGLEAMVADAPQVATALQVGGTGSMIVVMCVRGTRRHGV